MSIHDSFEKLNTNHENYNTAEASRDSKSWGSKGLYPSLRMLFFLTPLSIGVLATLLKYLNAQVSEVLPSHDHGHCNHHEHDHQPCDHNHDHSEKCDHNHDHSEKCDHNHDHSEKSDHSHTHDQHEGCGCSVQNEWVPSWISGLEHSITDSAWLLGFFWSCFIIARSMEFVKSYYPMLMAEKTRRAIQDTSVSSIYLTVGVPLLLGASALFTTFPTQPYFVPHVTVKGLMGTAAFGCLQIHHELEGAFLLSTFATAEFWEHSFDKKQQKDAVNIDQLPSHVPVCQNESGCLEPILREVAHVSPGSLILVHPGQVFALDGELVSQGPMRVDTNSRTGELELELVEKGGPVSSGDVLKEIVNGDKTVLVKTIRSAAESASQKFTAKLREKSENPKTNYFLRYYPLVVLLITGFLYFLGEQTEIFIRGPRPADAKKRRPWTYRAFVFLTVASPCSLAIGGPSARIMGRIAMSKYDIHVRSQSDHVYEDLANAQTLALDKTGTLTYVDISNQLIYSVTEEYPQSPFEEKDMYCILRDLEATATDHIYGSNLYETGISQCPEEVPPTVEVLEDYDKYGPTGRWEKNKKNYTVQVGTSLGESDQVLENIRQGCHMEADQKHAIILGIKDQKTQWYYCLPMKSSLWPSAPRVVANLRKEHPKLKVYVLSGDQNQDLVQGLASQIQVNKSDALYGLEPRDKLEKIQTWQKTQSPVIMVGDSQNDQLAFKAADVAIQIYRDRKFRVMPEANVVLKRKTKPVGQADDFQNLEHLFRIARVTARVLKQNNWIIGISIVCPIIIGLLGFVPLVMAVIIHEGGTLLVLLNSFRIYWHIL